MKRQPRKRKKPEATPAIFDTKHNQRIKRLGDVRYKHPSKIKKRKGNPRTHSAEQIESVKVSMEAFGNLNPIIVDENYVIIAGEARLQAAKDLYQDEVPVIVVSHLSETEKRLFRIADNKIAELGEWNQEALLLEFEAIMEADFNVELTGFRTAEIDAMQVDFGGEEQDQQADPADAVPEPPVKPVAQTGDIWVLGEHRLLCGSSLDARNWKRLMGDEVAVSAFVDPPYNVAISGHVSGLGKHRHREFEMASGEMSEDEFITFNYQYLEAMMGVLKDGAVLALCMDWRHLFELHAAIRRAGLSQLNLCVWNKTNAGMGSLYRSQHELVVIAKKGKAPHINNVQLGKYGRYRTNSWNYAGANSFGASRDQDLADHPTVKPIGLVADYVRDVTHHGDLVLDAFMGSGTTILAAERTGRRAAGIEIDPGYVDVTIRRWQDMTGEQAVLADTGQTHAAVGEERSDTAAGSVEAPAN